MGLWRGKKGSSVFYKIKNSNSAQKQGIRERNYEVSNPQTSSQAGQRMKLLPAQLLYGALKETIERSWQGVSYGEKTRQAFLKSALRDSVFPALEKGSHVAVPAPYLVSVGSLDEVNVVFDDNGLLNFNFGFEEELARIDVANLTQALLARPLGYKVGDQLTFILSYRISEVDTNIRWFVFSIILDYNDTTDLDSLLPLSFQFINGGYGNRGLTLEMGGDEVMFAGACVHSRDAETPMRSTTRLVVRTDALPEFYGSVALSRARASYMKRTSSGERDWPVDPDNIITINARPVSFNANGEEIADLAGGSVTGGANYNIGDIVSLVATANNGYTFNGWYPSRQDAIANTNMISNASPLDFVAGDTSIVGDRVLFFARFKADE